MQLRTETLFRISLTEAEAEEIRSTLVVGIDAQEAESASHGAVRLAAALTEALGIPVPGVDPQPSRRRRRRGTESPSGEE